MVTVAQARQQITKQQSQIEQQQRALMKAREIPRAVLARRGRAGMIAEEKRRAEISKREGLLKEARGELKKYELQVSGVERERLKQQQLQRDVKLAKEWAKKSRSTSGMTAQQQELYTQFRRERIARIYSRAKEKQLRELGVKFVGGGAGIESEEFGSFALSELPKVSPELMGKLESIGVIKVEKGKVDFPELIELKEIIPKKLPISIAPSLIVSKDVRSNTLKFLNLLKREWLKPVGIPLFDPRKQIISVTGAGIQVGKPTTIPIPLLKEIAIKEGPGGLKKYLEGKFGKESKTIIIPEVMAKVIDLIPETRVGVAVTAAALPAYVKLAGAYPRAAQAVDAISTAWNLKEALNPEQERSQRVLSGAFAGLGALSFISKFKPFIDKRSPKYIPIDETGIKFIPANTIGLTEKEIKALQGLSKTTIHVTNNPFFKFDKNGLLLIKAFPKEAGTTRRNLKLFNFYKSLSKGNPNAYLGYVGILDDQLSTPGSGVKITLKTPKINAYIFPKEKVTTTPNWVIKKGFDFTRNWQNAQSGKTFVPPENLFGLSIEGQVVSPAYSGEVLKAGKWIVISGKELDNALKKGEVVKNLNKGSIIQKVAGIGFTYYKQEPTSPALIKKIKLLDKIYKFLGTKMNRINLIEAKTLSVGEINSIKSATTLNKMKNLAKSRVKELDIANYNSFASKYNLPLTKIGGHVISSTAILNALSKEAVPSITPSIVSPKISKIKPSKVVYKPKVSVSPPSFTKRIPTSITSSIPKRIVSPIISPITSRPPRKPSIVSPPRYPARPPPPPPPPPPLYKPFKPLRRKIKRLITPRRPQGYDVFFKPIRRKKYVKINKFATSKERAKDTGAFIVDRSLSTNFFIRKSKQKPKPLQIKIPRRYFSSTQGKYRDYRIKKGERIPTPLHWIEKKGHPRLDISTEKKKLTGLALIARLRKKQLKKLGLASRTKRITKVPSSFKKVKPLIELKRKKRKKTIW